MFVKTISLAAIAVSVFVFPAAAHHSFSMFDRTKTITLNGTVKQFEWANPHSWIHILVEEEGGTVEYALEMQGTGQSTRLGWKPDTVKPGDKVVAQIRPLKTGGHGGMLLVVTLPNGQDIRVSAGPVVDPFGD